jgi:lysophospholipase
LSRAELVLLPESECPANAEVFVLTAPDGIDLRVARWPAEAGVEARGSVLLVHGYTEFIEKYFDVVSRLQARGFAVVTYDHRGQGLSTRLLDSRRGHVTSYADMVSDLIQVLDEAVVPGLPRPHVLMAHSMGGNVALQALQDHPGRFDRAVLSAPMTGFSILPVWLMYAIATIHVWLGLGTSYAWFSTDADLDDPHNRVTSDAARFATALALWRQQPDLVVGGVTWRWVREAAHSVLRVRRRRRLARITTPTLLASAGRDQVVSSPSQAKLASRAPAIHLANCPNAMHEILQESDEIQAEFWNHFDRFLANENQAA